MFETRSSYCSKKKESCKSSLFAVNIVDEKPLMQYIRPDFAQLTNTVSETESEEENSHSKKSLVAIRSGVKPKLREFEKKPKNKFRRF